MNQRRTFDLEERTTKFAKEIIRLCKSVPRDPINDRVTGQLAGCSGSVGANYREANDALGKKDFIFRMKISRKEEKETIHWLEIFDEANPDLHEKTLGCLREAQELKNIMSAIISKTA